MKASKEVIYLILFWAALVSGLMFIIGIGVGQHEATVKFQNSAVKAGAAEWVGGDDGRSTFKFKAVE